MIVRNFSLAVVLIEFPNDPDTSGGGRGGENKILNAPSSVGFLFQRRCYSNRAIKHGQAHKQIIIRLRMKVPLNDVCAAQSTLCYICPWWGLDYGFSSSIQPACLEEILPKGKTLVDEPPTSPVFKWRMEFLAPKQVPITISGDVELDSSRRPKLGSNQSGGQVRR